MIKKFSLFLLFIMGAAGWAVPCAPAASQGTDRPKIGLVLGGGGAKGAAHIGVLRVIEEMKVPVDFIAGTSMGAIVGALYASGYSVDEIESLITYIDWQDIFSGKPDRRDVDFQRKREEYRFSPSMTFGLKKGRFAIPRGIIKDQKINVLFEALMLHTADIDDFDKLSIPFRAVATDIETGEMVVMRSGKLADAARASMSVPGVFPPIELDGRVLIDGGMVRNLPVDIAREMGADVVICVDVGTPLLTRVKLTGPFVIMSQMISIMIQKNVKMQIDSLKSDDIYVHPDLGELGSRDFARMAEILQKGEEAARKMTEALSRYAISDREYGLLRKNHYREPVRAVQISSLTVDVEGDSGISPKVVESRLQIKEGDIVDDMQMLIKDAGIINGTGDFESVDMQMSKTETGAYDLLVRAREKSWGPNYLSFGIKLESDLKGFSRYNLLVDYTRRWVNRLGGEWKTLAMIGSPMGIYSEFYQPLTESRLFFLSPHIEWQRRPVDVYDDDNRIAQYQVSGYEAGLDAGIQPWMYGEARLGLVFGRYSASSRIGKLHLSDYSFDRSGIILKAILDQLDNLFFPNEGYMVGIDGFSALEFFGADYNYTKVEGGAKGAFTFLKQTVVASIRAGSHIGKELPFYDELELGGFLNLSGLHENQLRGQSMAIGRIISYHNMGRSFIGDLYVGGSLESGNVWPDDFEFDDLRYAGSLFLGYDTVLGPLYLALGLSEDDYAAYLYLGQRF